MIKIKGDLIQKGKFFINGKELTDEETKEYMKDKVGGEMIIERDSKDKKFKIQQDSEDYTK